MMNKQEIKDLLSEVSDLCADYSYICFKAPELLNKMHEIKTVPKDLQDEFDDALREIEYLENSL